MKREERNAVSRQRIGESALEEFAQYGYAAGSVNGICSRGNISKGILYHYFQDKDAIYLQCVQDCFDKLATFLRRRQEHEALTLEGYAEARQAFFQENPLHHRLFCDAVILPPPHLKEAILQRKAKLDEVNESLLRGVLSRERLRSDISLDQAVFFYRIYANMANVAMGADLESLYEIDRHNDTVSLAVKLFLYGVVARECE